MRRLLSYLSTKLKAPYAHAKKLIEKNKHKVGGRTRLPKDVLLSDALGYLTRRELAAIQPAAKRVNAVIEEMSPQMHVIDGLSCAEGLEGEMELHLVNTRDEVEVGCSEWFRRWISPARRKPSE